MLVTGSCGYAKYVDQSKAGVVISSPFKQQVLNEQLASLLLSDAREALAQRALTFADREDLYSMPEKAVEAIERVAKEKVHAV